jgi:hypothetical protein
MQDDASLEGSFDMMMSRVSRESICTCIVWMRRMMMIEFVNANGWIQLVDGTCGMEMEQVFSFSPSFLFVPPSAATAPLVDGGGG